MNIIDLIEKSMSYSIDSKEQENNSLTNIWFGPIRVRIQVPNEIEPAIDLLIDKVNTSPFNARHNEYKGLKRTSFYPMNFKVYEVSYLTLVAER